MDNCEKLVRMSAGLTAGFKFKGPDTTVQGVYTTVNIDATSVHFDGVFVTDSIDVSCHNASGVIYTHYSTSVRIRCTFGSVDVIKLSWAQLAKRLGLA